MWYCIHIGDRMGYPETLFTIMQWLNSSKLDVMCKSMSGDLTLCYTNNNYVYNKLSLNINSCHSYSCKISVQITQTQNK